MQKFVILSMIVFLLSGCIAHEPAPLPEIIPPIRMAITPANSYMGSAANSCSQEIPGVVITIDILPISEIDTIRYDLIITSGEGVTDWQYQLFEEKLDFIINPSNPITELNRDQILQILGGYITEWDEIAPEESTEISNEIIQVFLFGDQDDVTNLVVDQLPEDITINARTRYLPGAVEITQAVLSNPEGIGILPSRWITDLIKPISTDMDITYPIVMSVNENPAGSLRDLMGCMQLKVAKPDK